MPFVALLLDSALTGPCSCLAQEKVLVGLVFKGLGRLPLLGLYPSADPSPEVYKLTLHRLS